MKDRRPALCKVLFLFKNGTSISLDTPLSYDEIAKALVPAVGVHIWLDITEKDAKIARGQARIDTSDILTVTIFEIEQNPIVAIK